VTFNQDFKLPVIKQGQGWGNTHCKSSIPSWSRYTMIQYYW
jgi:hypothetical protein